MTKPICTSLPAAITLILSAAPLHCQSPTLDSFGGGALPGTTTLALSGPTGARYLLIPALAETTTTLPNLGVTFEVSLDLVGSAFGIPGFFGLIDGSGTASASLPFPNVPAFEDITLSFQALVDDAGTYDVSNLVRLTPQLTGTFRSSIESPQAPIAGGAVAASANGELVFFGGSGPLAQTYASRTEQWSVGGASTGFGLFAQSTALDDGRVLLTGGLDLTTGQPAASASIYDPATQQTTLLTMVSARAGHGASRLPDGRVLITGGTSSFALTTDLLALFAGVQASTEIFDPATDTFSPGPNLIEARAFHTSTTTAGGRVLIAGGVTLLPIVNIPTVSATAYLYNPQTGGFGLPSFFSGARFLHSAVGLDDGRVLLVGGLSLDLSAFLASGDIADLSIGTVTDCQVFSQGLFGGGSFATVGGLQAGRAGASVVALPGGDALIAGGFELSINVTTLTFELGATETADVFSSGSDTIAPTGSMAAPRFLATATNLPDGTVLIVGGGGLDSEIYQP